MRRLKEKSIHGAAHFKRSSLAPRHDREKMAVSRASVKAAIDYVSPLGEHCFVYVIQPERPYTHTTMMNGWQGRVLADLIRGRRGNAVRHCMVRPAKRLTSIIRASLILKQTRLFCFLRPRPCGGILHINIAFHILIGGIFMA